MTYRIESDDCPWTQGDSGIAAQYGEEFGETIILFSIRDKDNRIVCLCPWEPLSSKERQNELLANARAILKSLNRIALNT